ncbi:hypothetical protein SAMN04488691_10589 [Haloferax larsenii]|uniref:Uncharacterized protein n=2 Tax=Haloferax larsenii TaxID=302484 RepID=A0A1H7QMK6_HALLR|nr:hypothetical protein SAMN04488691_10589 [Haloferax larsenii]
MTPHVDIQTVGEPSTMSNSSSTVPRERLAQVWDVLANAQHNNTGVKLVAAPLRFVGFWTAVALPFLYLPLLHGGLESNELSVFVALVAVNAVALVVGHNYGR